MARLKLKTLISILTSFSFVIFLYFILKYTLYLQIRLEELKISNKISHYFQEINKPNILFPNCSNSSHHLNVPNYFYTHCVTCTKVPCSKVLFGQPEDYLFTKLITEMEKNVIKTPADIELISLSHNCEKLKTNYLYQSVPSTKEEHEFPIAYNILVHKDVIQLEYLLQTIYRPQNFYCIHVDMKSPDIVKSAVKSLANCFTNIFIASKLEKIVYAGFSRLQADINCMKDHAKLNSSWRYLINLASQAFPLKTNAEIVRILNIYNGSNDVEGIYGARILKSRFEQQWLETKLNSSNPIIVRGTSKNPAPPGQISIVRGSAYAVFSRDFVLYILNNKKAQDLLEWSRNTYSPDEHYWATLHHTYSNPHLNPPGGYAGIPDEKPWLAVYASWIGRDKCYGKGVHGVCVFGVKDIPSLVEKRELFANKFYYDYQPVALQCLRKYIAFKSQCPVNIDEKYYKSLPFVRKDPYRKS